MNTPQLPCAPAEYGDGQTFRPPAEWINSLPDPYRRWIHDLETRCDPAGDLQARRAAEETAEALRKQVEELTAQLNTPELIDFVSAVTSEAQHQRYRWGADHDAGKEPADWFWLLGYLAGKALRAHSEGDVEKALHHTISSAAALANWHAAILGQTNMRPGIDPVERGVAEDTTNGR